MTISDEKFISFTTFRKSGEPVSTATWIVPLDNGKVGFWTSSASGKLKRLRNNHAATLSPSDSRGRTKPGASTITATVEVVTSGPEFDAIQQRVRAKYGMMVRISHLFNTIGHLGKKFPYGDVGVIVTPSE
jgi:PPOX class probable F420-dependent enzyme